MVFISFLQEEGKKPVVAPEPSGRINRSLHLLLRKMENQSAYILARPSFFTQILQPLG